MIQESNPSIRCELVDHALNAGVLDMLVQPFQLFDRCGHFVLAEATDLLFQPLCEEFVKFLVTGLEIL